MALALPLPWPGVALAFEFWAFVEGGLPLPLGDEVALDGDALGCAATRAPVFDTVVPLPLLGFALWK